MEPELSAGDLAERWTLDTGNWELLANKSGATRLGFAALLNFFEAEGRFPRRRQELPLAAIRFLADQVHVPAESWASTAGQAGPLSITALRSVRSWAFAREALKT